MGVLSKLLVGSGVIVSGIILFRYFHSQSDDRGGATFDEIYAQLSAKAGGSLDEYVVALPESTYKRGIQAPNGDGIRPILLLYGTEYGASREIAYKLERRIRESMELSQNYWPRVMDMEDYQVIEFDKERLILCICSTYGEGVPPTSSRAFFDFMEASLSSSSSSPPPPSSASFSSSSSSRLDLHHIKFSVLAMGDKSYLHFCRAGRTLNSNFISFGAQSLLPIHEIDQEDWSNINKWFDALHSILSNDSSSLSSSIPLQKSDYLFEKQSLGLFGTSIRKVSRRTPYQSRLLSRRLLTKGKEEGKEDDKETYHLEFELEEDSGVTYTSGDALAILPTNCLEEVDRLLLHWKSSSPTQLVSIPPWNYTPLNPNPRTSTSTSFEDGLGDGVKTISLKRALIRCYDLKNIKPELFALLYRHITSSPTTSLTSTGVEIEVEAKKLEELLKEGTSSLKNWIRGRELIDVFQEFPISISKTSTELVLSELKQLLPRYYSISSSQRIDSKKVTVTAAIVRYQTHGRSRKGVTTTYLADRIQVGDRIPVFVNPNPDFRLPKESTKPIVLVGPGTGIAPFRAFLQERILLENIDRSSIDCGANLLFFGCRHADRDYLYKEELEEMATKGHLILSTAFSRDQPDRKVYVQHRLKESATFVWKLIDEQAAHLYICGDAQYMAPDVHKSLVEIIVEHGKRTTEEAEEYLADLERNQRYQKDVWFE